MPEQLLCAKAEDLLDVLKVPTLFHLEGINPQPLFICTLLHGNETTGFYAIQRLLKNYKDKPLPRAISLFIGNVYAASKNQRRLDNQDDYNRIWPGSHINDSAEKDMMQTVTNIMQKKKPFASIDIHNNTGRNPHYGCVNNLNPHGLVLASKFSNIAVYFTTPKGVQSSAFADFCPSVVLECGQSSDASGIDHALEFLETVLQLDQLTTPERNHLKLYHTIARVIIPKTVILAETITTGDKSIDDKSCGNKNSGDVMLNAELENKNFHQLLPGTEFATITTEKDKPIKDKLVIVNNESNEDISSEYLETKNQKLLLKKPVTLAMFTTDNKAIRQDCVCYFMEELHIG